MRQTSLRFHQIITVSVVLLLSLLWWLLSIFYQDYLIEQKRVVLQSKVDEVGNHLTSTINRRQAILIGIAASVKIHTIEELRNGHFELFASGLQGNDPTIRTIQFYPPSGPGLVFPIEGNEAVIGSTLADLQTTNRAIVREDVRRAMETRQITLSNPYELRQGGQGIVARLAIYDNDRFLGLVVVILNLDSLLEIPGLMEAPESDRFALKDTQGNVFFGKEQVFQSNPVVSQVVLPEGFWTLGAAPLSTWEKDIQPQLMLFWLLGLLLISLSGGITYLITSRQVVLEKIVDERTADLQESKERFSIIFRSSPIAIAVTGLSDGILSEVNDVWCRLFGFTKEEAVGRSVENLGILDRETASMLHTKLESDGNLKFVEIEISAKVGGRKSILISTEIITIRGKNFAVTLAIDVTNRKLDEQKISKQLDELRQWHDVTLNREDRVRELKDEVNDLRIQAGQPPRYPPIAEEREP